MKDVLFVHTECCTVEVCRQHIQYMPLPFTVHLWTRGAQVSGLGSGGLNINTSSDDAVYIKSHRTLLLLFTLPPLQSRANTVGQSKGEKEL